MRDWCSVQLGLISGMVRVPVEELKLLWKLVAELCFELKPELLKLAFMFGSGTSSRKEEEGVLLVAGTEWTRSVFE